MKKILLFVLFCVVVAFYACKKDKKGNMCWKCTIKITTYEPDNGHFTTSADQEICDKTEEEIRYYETARGNTANTEDGGRVVTEVACAK